MCPPGSALVVSHTAPPMSQRMKGVKKRKKEGEELVEGYARRERYGVVEGNEGRVSKRTVEEVAFLDAKLAYAGAEPEEGEAEDGAE